MKKNYYVLLLIIFSSIFFILPVILYFINFNNGLSPISDDWGNYGSLLSGTIASFLSFVNILLLTYTIREENKNKKDSKIQDEIQRLGNQFNNYLQLLKSTFTTEVFRADFKSMKLEFDQDKNIEKIVNEFVLNKSGNKYFLLENIIIILDKIKHLSKDEFEFYNNCLSIEFDDLIIKYLVVAINSIQYKNNSLMKKFLFWYISINPVILLNNYKSSKRELLNMSVKNGEFPYIEWK